MTFFLQAVAGFCAEPYDLRALFGARAPRRFDPVSEFACVAVHRALNQVGMNALGESPLFASTQYGNLTVTVAYLERLQQKGARLANPADFPNLVISSLGANLSLLFGAKGEVATLNQGAPCHLACLEQVAAASTELGLWVGAEESSVSHRVFTDDDSCGAVAAVVSLQRGRVAVEWIRTAATIPAEWGTPPRCYSGRGLDGAFGLTRAFAELSAGEPAWVIERGERAVTVAALRGMP